MAEELDLEGKVLDARVRQKKDTLANWEVNTLILLDGEQAFVVDANGQPINFKIGDGTKKFADLPYWIAYDQGQYVPITTTALPTPTATVGYSIVPEGTYTRAGQTDVVVPAGSMGVLNFGANTWSLGSSVPLPTNPLSNTVNQDTDKAITPKGVDDAITPLKEVIQDSEVAIQLPFTLFSGAVNTTNGSLADTSPNWLRTGRIKVTKTKGKIDGFGENATANQYRAFFYRLDNSFISSKGNGEISSNWLFDYPAGTDNIVYQVAGGSGVGSDPANSPYNNTFKVYDGETTPSGVKGEKIVGDINTPQIQAIEAAANTGRLFQGTGYPSSSIGNNGDNYLDNNSLMMYKKVNGSWGIGQFLGGEEESFYPNEFPWRPKSIIRQGNGYYKLKDFVNIRQEFVQSKIDTLTPYYLDPINGANGNNGLTKETAYKTLAYAISQGARLIYLQSCAGFYPRESVFVSQVDIVTNEPLILIGEGNVIFSVSDKGNKFTWTANSGCWSTARTNVTNVMDFDNLDADGLPTELAQVGSVALCQSTSNSYYTDGATLYVHPLNNLAPTAKIEVLLNSDASYTPTVNVPYIYFENVGFATNMINGAITIKNNSTTQFNTKAYFYKCFGYKNKLGNIFSLDNLKEVWVQDCWGIKPKNDIFNYHTSLLANGYERMKVLEIDCHGKDSGKDFPAEPSSNGSSIHEGGTIIRLNSRFDYARGGAIADVNDGIRSLNLGVKPRFNTATTGGSFLANGAGSIMWIYDGDAIQTEVGQYSVFVTDGKAVIRNLNYNNRLLGTVEKI